MSKQVINFTRGMPPVEVFPTDDLVECGEAAFRADPNVLFQYGRSPGYLPLREWFAERYDVGPDQIMVGNSSLELFAFITQVYLKPGDRVFVESPSYDRALTLLRRAGAEVVGVPLEADGLDLQILQKELSKAPPKLVYVISDFNNPTGITTSVQKRQALAELAQQYGFWIAEDSPYRPLRYHGQDVPTLYSLVPDRVLHMSSFSKLLTPGLRLGYLIAPVSVTKRLAAWAVDTYIGPVFPTQGLVNEYCRRGLLDLNIERLKQLYAPRLRATLSALDLHLAGASWTKPEGGFYVGVTLPQGTDLDDLRTRAEAAGLKLSDGRGFFPNPSDGARFLRLPFCSVTPEDIGEAVALLATIL